MLENSDAKAVIVEDDEQLAKIDEVRDRLPEARARGPDGGLRRWSDLHGRTDRGGRRAERTPSGRSAGARSLPTTSAPSSTRRAPPDPPKGCVISHGNYRAMLDMVARARRPRAATTTDLPVPAPRPLLRPADPAGVASTSAAPRLLGARPAEDRPEPRRGPPDLLPVGAADLREDLHGRERRRREGGRPEEARLQLGDPRRPRRCASASAPGRQLGLAAAQAVRVRRQAGALEDPRPVRRPLRLAITGAAPINPEILSFFDAAGVLSSRAGV